MEQLIAAALALVARFQETTAVHDEVAALEAAIPLAQAEQPVKQPTP